ncbi:MAG: hypothetical protein R3E88_21590 [Myxococcota bacterium]|nr:hypothetical protein [Myxococcales bacterium]
MSAAARPGEAHGGGARGLDRLELRVERLRAVFRFTFAFHAREVRFECDQGEGFERVFPETFSFRAARHDPAELFLQLDDLLQKARLLSPRAHRRDARELVMRLLSEAPRYLDQMRVRLGAEGALGGDVRVRMHQDMALLAQILLRFLETRDLGDRRSLRVAGFALRKLAYECLRVVMAERVDADYLERYVRGEADPVDPGDDPSESGFFYALEGDDRALVDRLVVRMTERAFYMWLEQVCLDETNQAFEKEDSPFRDREAELLAAIAASPERPVIARGCDLVPFLRRADRDSRRAHAKLETWFLRRYDIRHSAAIIHHAARLERGEVADGKRALGWHSPRMHSLELAVLVAPFALAAFFYERAPRVFDWWCAGEVAVVNATAFWFLIWKFCVRRDLTFFNSSVPRIFAGVIVGYLPVFLIDEVWDLASRDVVAVGGLTLFLALATLLYIYIEVRRRLGSTQVAFDRARAIFQLGVLQALTAGLVMTTIVGPFMVSRNWAPDGGGALPIAALRSALDPIAGQLPRIIGVEPFLVFPAVVLLMTFLSFFIGVFLQLMWEDLPITEPL